MARIFWDAQRDPHPFHRPLIIGYDIGGAEIADVVIARVIDLQRVLPAQEISNPS